MHYCPLINLQYLGVPRECIEIVCSTFHDQFSKKVRFQRYMRGETNEEWVRLLGPDVLFLTHPEKSADVTKRYISFHPEISAEDRRLLYTAAYIHDWGELIVDGIGIGDITKDNHTEEHTKIEKQVFELILNYIPESQNKNLIKKAYYEIAMDTKSELGKIFNHIEVMGYLQTAIRAYQGIKEKKIQNWAGLTGNTLAGQMENILDAAKNEEFTQWILNKKKDVITENFKQIINKEPPEDNEGGLCYDKTRLENSYEKWQGWCK